MPNCLGLSCRIENDKVESYSITQSFNKQENWTKALKYTLCNLKWVLYWFVGNTNFQPLSGTVSSQAEVPAAAGSLYSKQPTNTKFQSWITNTNVSSRANHVVSRRDLNYICAKRSLVMLHHNYFFLAP